MVDGSAAKVKICLLLSETGGTAWFDCVQVEKDKVANKYNLIRNGGMEQGATGAAAPDGWIADGLSAPADGVVYGTGLTGVGKVLRIEGSYNSRKAMHQVVSVSGKAGDVFTLSGWSMADSIPFDGASSGECRVAAAVIGTDGSDTWYTADFNPYVTKWQYTSHVFTAPRDYQSIHVYVFYGHNRNKAQFNNIQLQRDDAQSYIYDKNGDLTSTSSAAEKAQFNHDQKGNLLKLSNATGSSYEYGYNSANQLKEAKGSDGSSMRFTYDGYGNPTSSVAESGEHTGAVTTGRVYYLRQKTSGKYLEIEGGKDSDYANVRQGVYTGTASQKWKVVEGQNGYVQLIAMGGTSSKVLYIQNGENKDGANAMVYQDWDADSQNYRFKLLQDGSYQIEAKCAPGRILTNQGGYTEASNIDIRIINGEHNDQSWYLEPADRGTEVSAEPKENIQIMIRNRKSGQYWGLQNGVAANGNVIYQMYRGYKGPQGFILRKLSPGSSYWTISPASAPDKALQVSGKLAGDYPRIEVAARDGSEKQEFSITRQSNGTYKISPRSNGSQSLQMVWGEYENEISVLIAPNSANMPSMQWVFEELGGVMNSSMTYTSDGSQVSSVTDSRGQKTSTSYDGKNRLPTVQTDAKGFATHYTYDLTNDHLTSVYADAGKRESVSYSYNNDQLTGINTSNGNKYSFSHDVFGNTTGVKIGAQTLVTNTYLAANGPLKESTYGNGQKVGYTYDKYGRVTEKKYNGTVSFENRYDSSGALLEHIDRVNNERIFYQYDFIGRVNSVKNTNNSGSSYQYDSKNRVKSWADIVIDRSRESYSLVFGDGTAAKPNVDAVYQMDINGAAAETYQYDSLGRLTSAGMPGTSYKTEYAYLPGKAPGSTTGLVQSVKAGGKQLTYTYDANGNIETISENGVLQAQYIYDQLGQLIRENNKAANRTYTYTYVGANRTARQEYAYAADNGSSQLLATVNYAYTDANWPDKLTGYNGQPLTYDAIGNPLSYRDGMKFTWKNGRQLATANINGKSLSYQYDVNGIRTSKTMDGVTTKYWYNGNGNLVLTSNGTVTMEYLYDAGGSPFGVKYNNQAMYRYMKNVQGDIIGLVDGAGNVVVSYAYDTWGNLQSITGSAKDTYGVNNALRYRGYYYDTESGLYYLQSRYYDPAIGRFLNADGLVSTGQGIVENNMFAYCGNNPVMRADPSGNSWLVALIVTVIVVVVAVTATVSIANEAINKSSANDTEKALAKKDYFAAYQVNKSKDIAVDYLNKTYGSKNDKDGTQVNAYRHAMWNAVMTDKIGEEKAKKFADAHEDIPNNPTEHKIMDLHNNELGRKIALDHAGQGYDVFSEKIQEAINNGEAIVLVWDQNAK